MLNLFSLWFFKNDILYRRVNNIQKVFNDKNLNRIRLNEKDLNVFFRKLFEKKEF